MNEVFSAWPGSAIKRIFPNSGDLSSCTRSPVIDGKNKLQTTCLRFLRSSGFLLLVLRRKEILLSNFFYFCSIRFPFNASMSPNLAARLHVPSMSPSSVCLHIWHSRPWPCPSAMHKCIRTSQSEDSRDRVPWLLHSTDHTDTACRINLQITVKMDPIFLSLIWIISSMTTFTRSTHCPENYMLSLCNLWKLLSIL